MVDFGYNDNNIKNDKHFKPISNGNIANTSMIALLEEPLPCRKTWKEWKFKYKSLTKHKLIAYLMYVCRSFLSL